MKPQKDPSDVVTEVEQLKKDVKRLSGWVTTGKIVVPILLGFLGYTNLVAIPKEVSAALKGSVLDEYKLRAETAAVAAESALKQTQDHAGNAGTAAESIKSLLADMEKRRPIQNGDQISLKRDALLLVVDNFGQGDTIRTGWREEHDDKGRTKFKIEKQ